MKHLHIIRNYYIMIFMNGGNDMKEKDFGYTSREGWDEGIGAAIEGWDG